MTTTVAAQPTTGTGTDEIEIVRTPPTVTDAQLILQMAAVDAATGANEGFGVLSEFDPPPTLGQLRKKHPRGSTEFRQVMAFAYSAETIATFVRQGLLNEALVNDLYWVSGGWALIEKIARGMRKEAGEPRIMENAEWLAKRAAS
jgi:hypothetical protein